MLGDDLEKQTHQVLKNIGHILMTAGFDYENVVKLAEATLRNLTPEIIKRNT